MCLYSSSADPRLPYSASSQLSWILTHLHAVCDSYRHYLKVDCNEIWFPWMLQFGDYPCFLDGFLAHSPLGR